MSKSEGISTFLRYQETFDQVADGVDVMGDSLGILTERPILLTYPLIGGVLGAIWIVVGIGVLAATVFGLGLSLGPLMVLAFVVILGTYVAFAFTNVLFTAALIYEVRDYNRGVELNIRTGLRAALDRWSTLLLWAIVSWTVGFFLTRRRSDDEGLASQFADEAVEAGWTAATFFVVPVILFEDATWRTVIGKSADRLTDAWAEVIGAVVGLRIVAYVISLVGGGIVSVFSFLFIVDTLGAVIGTLVAAPVIVLGVLVNETLQGVVKGTMYDQVVVEEVDIETDQEASFTDVVAGEDPTA